MHQIFLNGKAWVLIIALFGMAGGLMPQAWAQEADDLVLITKTFEDGFYDVSQEHAKAFLEKHPESDRKAYVLFVMGRAYFELGQYKRAVDVFEKITELETESSYYDKGFSLWRAY